MNESLKRCSVLVTGATGFIGSKLLEHLLKINKYSITCSLREEGNLSAECGRYFTEVRQDSDWSGAIHEGQIIIHLAARAHVVKEHSKNPESCFHQLSSINGNQFHPKVTHLDLESTLVFANKLAANAASPVAIWKP